MDEAACVSVFPFEKDMNPFLVQAMIKLLGRLGSLALVLYLLLEQKKINETVIHS